MILLGVFFFACGGVVLAADAPGKAPEFEADGWINTEKPISIKDLKGQVVVIDFWTYCCINCMHVFPDLAFLEQKYKDQPVVVIGVHSGKFNQEKDAQNIKQAVLRHNISHPVAVDSDYNIWNAFDVHAWPTVVVIDSEGNVVGKLSGEGHRDQLDKGVAALLEEGKKNKTLGKHLTFKTERESFKSGVLEFPGKVLADAAGKRLFIADTNHNRVLVADLDGKVSTVVGDGKIGLKDGAFRDAEFHQPQGMCLSEDGQTLYVTDTENHALRAIDLAKKTVATLAGTGEQSQKREVNGDGAVTMLSSPWDVVRVGKVLYMAMAGTHQIWTYDPGTKKVAVFAGTGRESRIDNPVSRAAFAQPSGLSTDGTTLYVADSEVSSIRAVTLGASATVSTVAGSGNLFGFGTKDGKGPDALFQHPLGVALDGDTLFVADTFNRVIRKIDLKANVVSTWLGSGKSEPGTAEDIGFYEPGGLSVGGRVLYIADTNHHRIVAVDIATKKVRVLDVTLPAK